jgi:FkbM family methyltransferase
MRFPKGLRIARRALFAYLRRDHQGFERHWRRLLFLSARGHVETLTFRRGETTWTVPVSTDSVAKNLFVEGAHQGRETRAVLAWLKERGHLGAQRSTLVDVGANLGAPSIPIALATGKQVLAIEPMPSNFELLRRNVESNGLGDRVICLQAAISVTPGEVEMVWHPRGGNCEVRSEGSLQGFGTLGSEHRTLRVPALPLDDALQAQGIAPEEVAAVWSDTQGYERQVMASGKPLWTAGAALFVELWPQGLRVHGGIEPFVETATQCFRHMILRKELLKQGAAAKPRPIEQLGTVLEKLGDRHTDALLLPGSP